MHWILMTRFCYDGMGILCMKAIFGVYCQMCIDIVIYRQLTFGKGSDTLSNSSGGDSPFRDPSSAANSSRLLCRRLCLRVCHTTVPMTAHATATRYDEHIRDGVNTRVMISLISIATATSHDVPRWPEIELTVCKILDPQYIRNKTHLPPYCGVGVVPVVVVVLEVLVVDIKDVASQEWW